MNCSKSKPALSLLMKYIVTGQHQKVSNFLGFHWSPHGSLVSVGQHFVTIRVVHLTKWTKTSKLPNQTEADLITESDQAVRAMPSCNSWFSTCFQLLRFFCISYKNCNGMQYISMHIHTDKYSRTSMARTPLEP